MYLYAAKSIAELHKSRVYRNAAAAILRNATPHEVLSAVQKFKFCGLGRHKIKMRKKLKFRRKLCGRFFIEFSCFKSSQLNVLYRKKKTFQ